MGNAIRIANAPCSWGVLEFGLEGETAGPDQVLAEIATTGYAGTELGDWGFLPTAPLPLWAALQKHDLALVGGFVPVALADPEAHAAGEATALRIARLLRNAGGEDCLIVLADDNGTVPIRTEHAGRVTPEMGLEAEGWEIFAAGAERIARAVREQVGLRTVFHHHCAGYVETPAELEALMDRTDPELLGLCLDTGHTTFGGGDPLQALASCGERVWHVHFKDFDAAVAARAVSEGWDYFRAVREGVFCELGQGRVDFPAVRDALLALEYRGWIVVEQDVLPSMGSPRESAWRNREYLRSIGL
jgi:inosose dehydratase